MFVVPGLLLAMMFTKPSGLVTQCSTISTLVASPYGVWRNAMRFLDTQGSQIADEFISTTPF